MFYYYVCSQQGDIRQQQTKKKKHTNKTQAEDKHNGGKAEQKESGVVKNKMMQINCFSTLIFSECPALFHSFQLTSLHPSMASLWFQISLHIIIIMPQYVPYIQFCSCAL